MQVVLECVRYVIGTSDEARLRNALSGAIDWNEALLLATRLKVGPYLHWATRRLDPSPLGEEDARGLRAAFAAVASRNVGLTAELVRVARHLGVSGVSVLAFKGPVSALLTQRNLALRPFRDLDLLVRRGDAARAIAVLGDIGLRPSSVLSACQLAALIRYQHEVTLQSPTRGTFVDLHWAPIEPPFGYASEDALWKVAVEIDLQGVRLLTLSPGDRLLHACVDASKGLWRELHVLVEIAEAVRTSSPADWRELEGRAAQARKVGAVSASLEVVARVLGVAPPTLRAFEARPRAAMLRAARDAANRLQAGSVRELSWTRAKLAATWVLDSRLDRMRWLALAAAPSFHDVAAVALPASLAFAYRLVWFGRTAARAITGSRSIHRPDMPS